MPKILTVDGKVVTVANASSATGYNALTISGLSSPSGTPVFGSSTANPNSIVVAPPTNVIDITGDFSYSATLLPISSVTGPTTTGSIIVCGQTLFSDSSGKSAAGADIFVHFHCWRVATGASTFGNNWKMTYIVYGWLNDTTATNTFSAKSWTESSGSLSSNLISCQIAIYTNGTLVTGFTTRTGSLSGTITYYTVD